MTATITAAESLVDPGEAGGYQVRLAGGAASAGAPAWDAVVLAAGGGIFHSHAWFSAFEAATPGRMVPAHLLAYHGAELVGICPAYLVHECPRLAYALSLDRPQDLRAEGPVLLSHGFAALAGGPLAVPGHERALPALDTGMRRAASLLGAWAHGYVNLTPGRFSGWLLGQGYATAEVAMDYRLTSRWESAGEYWSAMRSHRRRSLRGAGRRALAQGYKVSLEHPDPAEVIPLIHGLLADRGTPAPLLPGPFLQAVLSRLAPYERTVTARTPDGVIRAVFTGWRFGSHQSMWQAGLDPICRGAFEPYHAMLAVVVETAVGEGVSVIDLGRANGDVKRRYGALPVPLLLALRSGRRDRDALLHLWCRDLQQRNHAVLSGLETSSRCC